MTTLLIILAIGFIIFLPLLYNKYDSPEGKIRIVIAALFLWWVVLIVGTVAYARNKEVLV